MPITGAIPLPETGMDAFLQQLQQGTVNRQKQQELMETGQYHQGTLEQQKAANDQLNQYRMGELDLKKQELPAELALKRAQAKYYEMGGGARGGGVGLQNQMALMKQAIMDNPGIDLNQANQITSAWLSGSPTLPDGSPTPPMSGNAQQLLLNVQGKNAPVAVKNQAANYDVLYNNLNDFDIGAVKEFAGPKGVLKLAQAKAQMAANPDDPNVDPMARRYLTAMNQSILNMDEMRKAFGTSVVPDYVYKTLGRLVNPNDSIWLDPKQVEMTYKKLIEEVKKNRDTYFEKVKHGVTATLPAGEVKTAGKQTSAEKPTKNWIVKDGKLVEA